MRAKGLEPSRFWHWLLRPTCLPFHHARLDDILPEKKVKIKLFLNTKAQLFKKVLIVIQNKRTIYCREYQRHYSEDKEFATLQQYDHSYDIATKNRLLIQSLFGPNH